MSKSLTSYTNFNKGINTTSSYDELDPAELITAINIDLKARGGYAQRKGCSIYKTLLDESEEVLQFPISRLIDYPDKPLLVIDESLRDWDNTVITLLLNSSNIDYEFFTNSKLYLLDGTEYWVYDGTTCSAVTAGGGDLTPIKRCTHLVQRGQRMFALGDPQNPNYLYFSDIGDPTTFQASSIVKAVTDDNDILVGFALFADNLMVFKNHEVFKWSGWDPTSDVTFNPLDVRHGAVSSRTIQVSEDYLIFADEEGVFCLTTVETDVIKSYNISKTIESIYQSLTNKDGMKSVVYKGNYYLACCDNGTGVNNKVLKASLGMPYNGSSDEGVSALLFPWVVYTGWSVADWMVLDGELYFSSAIDGHIYKAFDGLNDVSTAVSSEATHYFKLQDPATRKKLKRLFLIAPQDPNYACTIRLDIEAGYTTISKSVSLNESGAWDTSEWDESLWDWVDTVIKEIRVGKNISRLKVKVSHSAVDEVMAVYGFSAYYKVKKPRGSVNGVSDI